MTASTGVAPPLRASEVVWLLPVALATAATFVTAHHVAVVAVLVAVAVSPWVADAAGRALPGWLLGVLSVVPVVAVLGLEGLNACLFVATTAVCRLASEAHRPAQVVAVALVAIAVPFAALAGGPFDVGIVYFVIGNLLGTGVGLLLAHTRRLGARLRAADAQVAALAAREERARLARDVHDLVAHSLTVVVLQVGGARRVLPDRPAEAAAALERAERVCRDSLDGIREVVGLLRPGDGEGDGTVDLVQLVDTYRAAGVEVTADLDPHAEELSFLVRGVVFRVVREALANAARHRPAGSEVTVRTVVTADGVEVEVANPGAVGDPGATRSGPGGHGLRGLRDQVARVGGDLVGGPEGGRWVVRCRLPRAATVAPVTT